MLEYQKECELEELNGGIVSECDSPISQESETLCSGVTFDTSSSDLNSIVLPSHGIFQNDIKVSINGVDGSLLKITSEAELKSCIYQTIQDKELALLKARSYRD